jgi:hypothetical protein
MVMNKAFYASLVSDGTEHEVISLHRKQRAYQGNITPSFVPLNMPCIGHFDPQIRAVIGTILMLEG